jgi:hypothetical protein
MSNMMPGDNSGAEPRPHDPRCVTQCVNINENFVETDSCSIHETHICNCEDVDDVDWKHIDVLYDHEP